MILIPLLLGSTCWAADVVFAPKLDDYYGTKVDVKCSIDRGMEITLIAPLAAGNMRFMLSADPKCKLKKNGNYHTIQTRLSGCNNEIFMDSTTLTITNTIVNVMSFGRNPIRIESPVGCLFYSQEVSVGALMDEQIPLEIAPTRRPSVTDVEEGFDEVENVSEYGQGDDDNNTEDALDYDTVDDDSIDKEEIPVTENDHDKDGDSNDAEDEPVDVDSDGEDRPTSDNIDNDDDSKAINDPSDPNAPVARDGLPDKTDNSPSDLEVESDDPNEPDVGTNTQTGPESSNEDPTDPSAPTDTDDEAIHEDGDEQVKNNEGEDYEYSEDDDSDTGIVRENDKVKVNLLTTEATLKPTRITTTPWPTTKETATGIILVDNGSEFEEEDESEDYDDYFKADTETTDDVETTVQSKDPSETEDHAENDETDNETDNNDTSDREGGEEVSIIEDEVKDGIPDTEDGNDNNDDIDDEDGGDIPLIPKRSCFPFCEVQKPKKEKKPKKDKKETLWRVVARGNGLFFARMHLFTDDTFSKAWMYPPSLKTNDTIYAGVVLANGPSEATVSLTSCWASNMRHEIINLKTPELQKDEITLPLINDGCAVTSPPDLVKMVENGESQSAKFTSSVFQFVGYDTAYLYCRVRVCPQGPCPQKCDQNDPEYEYYDIDVGLGIHGETEDDFESSGDEIFDMPKFEMLIGEDPNSPKVSSSFDPYKDTNGPMVAATIYRKYEYSQEISKQDISVSDITNAERKPKSILENQSIVQAVLLGLLGAACVTLILLSVFVIRKRNQEKSLE